MQESFTTSASPSAAAERVLKTFKVAYERRPDGILVVPQNLDLSGQGLTALPDLSSVIVEGSFFCACNALTSLKGAPQTVGGDFLCGDNKLTSLEGAPKRVGGNFSCNDNRLASLKGAPQTVKGSFYCFRNQLISLEGAPDVGDDFGCDQNILTSLKGGPEFAFGAFSCSDNRLTSLEGAPKAVERGFYCSSNQLTSLEHGPQVVGGNYFCHNNRLTCLEHAPKKFIMLKTDFGDFTSWKQVPEALHLSEETKALQRAAMEETIYAATVLQSAMKVGGPLRLKR